MSEEPVMPPPPGAVSTFARPHDTLHTVNLATQIASIIVVTILVLLRIFISVHLRKTLGLEDYMTVARWGLFIAFCATMILLNVYGGEYHAWDVPRRRLPDFLKTGYATTLIYIPMAYVVKLALLAVMLRIFAPDPRKVMIIYVSAIVLGLYYVPAVFIKIFFCKPISAYWYGTANGGRCINQRKVIMADAVISIVSDLWILILPVPMLRSLQMSTSKKLRVVGVLGAGGLATAFSIWRLVMMFRDAPTRDITWFWIHIVLTANAEAGIGLICACLPMVSSYVVSLKSKSRDITNGSCQQSHELCSWNKLPGSKRNSIHNSLLLTQTDQENLISTIEVPEPHGGSRASLQEGDHSPDRPVLHKEVVLSQTYEVVK